MSAPPRPPLKVFVCPECGEQLWDSDAICTGGVFSDRPMHVRVKAEEVEVIPVADFEGFKERLTQMPDCYRYVCPKAERS